MLSHKLGRLKAEFVGFSHLQGFDHGSGGRPSPADECENAPNIDPAQSNDERPDLAELFLIL